MQKIYDVEQIRFNGRYYDRVWYPSGKVCWYKYEWSNPISLEPYSQEYNELENSYREWKSEY